MKNIRAHNKIVYLNTILSSLLFTGSVVHAREYFNPALLLNTEGAKVADLASFEQGFQLPGNYRVNVYLNDNFAVSKELNFSQTEQSDTISGGLKPCLDANWLLTLGIKIYDLPNAENIKSQACVDIKQYIPEAAVNYNFNLQRLDLSIPQIWISQNAKGYIPPSEWDHGITAGYLNYNLNGNKTNKSDNIFLSLNSGFNIAGFRLKNLSTFNYVTVENGGKDIKKWENIQSYVEKSIVPLKSELVLGDSTVQNMVYDSIGFRGARLYSSDAMLPNSMQGYAPVVRGIANSKSIIKIRQNGYIVYQTTVNPGPFEITDLTAMALSGNLDVTVEESSGTQQHFIVPYSGIPMLLREGRTTFDLTAGEFRSGNQNQDKPLFFQGVVSRGLGHGVTLFGGTQVSSNYKSGLLGLGKNMGDFGAFSFDMTHANSTLADDNDYAGQSYRLLYSKSLNKLGTTFQLLGYRYSTRGFYTLNDVAYKTMEQLEPEVKYDSFGNPYYDPSSYYNLNFVKKGRFQFNVTQSMGDWGSLYGSANYQTYWNAPKSAKSYQLGYSNTLRYLTYTLSWAMQESPNLYEKKNNSISASFSIPLNAFFGSKQATAPNTYSNTSLVRNSTGGNSFQTGINGTLGDERQFSYNIQQGHNTDTGGFGTASARLATKYGIGGVGFNFANDGKDRSFNYDLAGGMILHSGGLTLGQTLGDTNVLIDAQGAKDVKLENSNNVHTDSRGYAILPFAENYRLNRIALETNSLDEKTEILNNVQNLVPMRGAIVKAKFDSRIGNRALVNIRLDGGYVPYGSTVKDDQQKVSSMVGQEGQAYISGLADKGRLTVTWGDKANESCSADYVFNKQTLEDLVPTLELVCK